MARGADIHVYSCQSTVIIIIANINTYYSTDEVTALISAQLHILFSFLCMQPIRLLGKGREGEGGGGCLALKI